MAPATREAGGQGGPARARRRGASEYRGTWFWGAHTLLVRRALRCSFDLTLEGVQGSARLSPLSHVGRQGPFEGEGSVHAWGESSRPGSVWRKRFPGVPVCPPARAGHGLGLGRGRGPQWNANLVGPNLADCQDRWGLTGEEVESRDHR